MAVQTEIPTKRESKAQRREKIRTIETEMYHLILNPVEDPLLALMIARTILEMDLRELNNLYGFR